MTEEQLLTELGNMGIEVESHPLSGTCRGLFLPKKRLVVLREGMSYPQRRSTLAHELIHARRDDDGHQEPRIERKVYREAAQLLISPSEYMLAETLHGPIVGMLAKELDVTPRIIQAYQETIFSKVV